MVVLPIISAVQPIWAQKVSNKPLNIVCIFTDDHAFQTISAYGHPISKLAPTPNIDRLAGNGMLFTQSFVENSISAPSRATLLTGLYSHQHGQTRLGCCLNPQKQWFTELLQKKGYVTSVFGKWHLNVEPKGFDHYDILFDQGEYYNPKFRRPDTNGEYIKEKGYATKAYVFDRKSMGMDAIASIPLICHVEQPKVIPVIKQLNVKSLKNLIAQSDDLDETVPNDEDDDSFNMSDSSFMNDIVSTTVA